MKKPKFYVVWKGRQTGIFNSWEACSEQVSGYSGAEFKAFESLPAAKAALRSTYEQFYRKSASPQTGYFAPPEREGAAPTQPLIPSICVDAACSGVPGPVEWRGVLLETGDQIFHQGPYFDGTNNIGEFLALVHALAWLEKHNHSMPIYSDSKIALSWVRARKCRTNLTPTARNADLFALIARAEGWLAEHAPGVKLLKWDTAAWGEIPADFGRK